MKVRKTTPAQRRAIKKWQHKNKGLKRIYRLRTAVREYLRIASLEALMDLQYGVSQAIRNKENE